MADFLDLAGDDTPNSDAPKRKTFADLAEAYKPPKADAPARAPGVAGAPLLAQPSWMVDAVTRDMRKNGMANATVNGMPLNTDPASVAPAAPVSTPATPAPPAPSAPRPSMGPFDDAANFIARAGANTGNTIYGGLKGLGTLVTGQGIDAAADAVRSGGPIPVVAPTQATAQLEGALGAVQTQLNKAADWAQRGTEATGVPGAGAMGAIAKAGIENAPLLLGAGPRTERTAAEVERLPTPPVQPGQAPTLAHASPELQQAVAAAGGRVDPAALARHVEAETLPVPGRLTAGQATQDPALISREMNGRGKEKPSVPPQFYQQQGQTLAANMEAIRTSAAPDIPISANVIDHGQTLLDAYKAKDAAVQADIAAKYQALRDANGGQFPFDAKAAYANTQAALAKELLTGDAPPSQMAALRSLSDDMGTGSMEQFLALRRNLGNVARTASDGNTRMAASVMIEQLESLPLSASAEALNGLANEARSAARARFDAIRADPAYKAAVDDPTPHGAPSPAADKFFNAFVRDGRRENVARMQANLQDNPTAVQTIAAGTLDHLKSQLKADPVTGNFSQANYNKALQTLGPKMGSLVDPATAQQLQAVGGFAKNAQTQPRGSYVNNSNTAVELAAQGAKALAEHGTNALFSGIPVGTVGRRAGGFVADTVGARKAANNALAPGAGLTRFGRLSELK